MFTSVVHPAEPEMQSCRRKRAANDQVCFHTATGMAACHDRESPWAMKRGGKVSSLQSILLREFVLDKRFRSDGPVLGAEFDRLPDGAFSGFRPDSGCTHLGRKEKQGNSKMRKLQPSQTHNCMGSEAQRRNGCSRKKYGIGKGLMGSEAQRRNGCSRKKYGIGKGLMAVWHAANFDPAELPTNFMVRDRRNSYVNKNGKAPRRISSKTKNQLLAVKQRKLAKQVSERKRPITRKRKGGFSKDKNQIKESRRDCKLSLEAFEFSDQEMNSAMEELLDDEELELREKQAGPNPLPCPHLEINERHGCSLCKDLLAKFPPQSVKMKLPLNAHPWDTSPSMVKKLFKVFRFLYTHSVILEILPFTLDEFAFAFHEKESFLLGKIHVTLLAIFLCDVEKDFESASLPRAPKDSKYLAFLNFVRRQEYDVTFWNKCLNSLTWTEILRQVLIAAGYGASQNLLRRQSSFKDDPLVSVGLRHGTLKGELINILYGQGSKGMKISDLAKAPQVVGLNLPEAHCEMEDLIHSTLSGDVTLFEKISPCAYRLRLNPQIFKAIEIAEWDTEESGSVDDESADSISNSDCNDSGFKSGTSDLRLIHHMEQNCKSNHVGENMEIDESHPGEPWLLGLMEGEYSDLSIDEKLNVLVALVDLGASGPSMRMEDPVSTISIIRPNVYQNTFGAKIKRSTSSKQVVDSTSGEHVWRLQNVKQIQGAKANTIDKSEISHPMQSAYLGSDRRYNSYWLFLGPCEEKDPGHRRVYFESSEDGHWEVIDTMEALCSLISALDCRGTRESCLYSCLQAREASLCQAMAAHSATQNEIISSSRIYKFDGVFNCGDENSPISDVDNGLIVTNSAHDPLAQMPSIVDLGKYMEENKQKMNQHQAFDNWIWKYFYSVLSSVKYGRRSYLEFLVRCKSCHDLYWRDEKHCKTCHFTFALDFDMEERYAIHAATCKENYDGDHLLIHKVLPSKLQSLKAAMHVVEANMPEDAFNNSWRNSGHKLWVNRLKRTSSLHELLQVLSDLVNGICEEWLVKSSVSIGPNTAFDEIVGFFPTIPQTSSSVALWLAKLDAVIAPHLEGVHSSRVKKNAKSKTLE